VDEESLQNIALSESPIFEQNEQEEEQLPALPGNRSLVLYKSIPTAKKLKEYKVTIENLDEISKIIEELAFAQSQLTLRNKDYKSLHSSSVVKKIKENIFKLNKSINSIKLEPIKNILPTVFKHVKSYINAKNKGVKIKVLNDGVLIETINKEIIKEQLITTIKQVIDQAISTNGLEKFPDNYIIELSLTIIKNQLQAEIEILSKLRPRRKMDSKAFYAALSNNNNQEAIGLESFSKINGRLTSNLSPYPYIVHYLMKIPYTSVMLPILIIDIGDNKFGILQEEIEEIISIDSRITNINEKNFSWKGEIIPLINLHHVLSSETNEILTDNKIILCRLKKKQYGFIAKNILAIEDLLIKQLPSNLSIDHFFKGASLINEAKVIMILDLVEILKANNIMDLHCYSPYQALGPNTNESTVKKNSFLMVELKDNTLKAVPLNLVSKVDRLDFRQAIYQGNIPIIKYKYRNIYTSFEGLPQDYNCQEQEKAIIFAIKGKFIGVLVNDVKEIVELPVTDSLGDNVENIVPVINIKGNEIAVLNPFNLQSSMFNITKTTTINDNLPENSPRVLLIETSNFFRKFIPPVLLTNGYKVETVENIDQATLLLNNGEIFNVVILDLNAPLEEIEEFIKICQFNRFKAIPIIGLYSNNINNYGIKNIDNIYSTVLKNKHEDILISLAEAVNNNS
jgi:two-component system chemotaxis sensor kinase CheA